jgi:predicted acyltransferase
MYVIEMLNKTKWTYFFVVFGRNPLSIYLLSELLLITLYLIPVRDTKLQPWLFNSVLKSFASPVNASLLFALLFMLICWLVGYIMDKRKVYIRV